MAAKRKRAGVPSGPGTGTSIDDTPKAWKRGATRASHTAKRVKRERDGTATTSYAAGAQVTEAALPAASRPQEEPAARGCQESVPRRSGIQSGQQKAGTTLLPPTAQSDAPKTIVLRVPEGAKAGQLLKAKTAAGQVLMLRGVGQQCFY